ncbi:BQ2448_3942 [Microbotryum intermedium]|uniref:BQ2448_3942 protein n=1 Tax=Microbotryum intermedium TaxID=269621 RepID=A0A238FGU5_9BASI|nr:BQ2448_3942 [Microbotryum intermedium]
MDSSLFKMIIFLCVFFAAWIVFILLCLETPLDPRHHRTSSRSSRGEYSAVRNQGLGFEGGRGGNEGWEMSALGGDREYE